MAYKQTTFGVAGFSNEPRLGFSNISRQNPSMAAPHFRDDSMHHVSELDNILESERMKFRDIKARMESDLENERRMRLEFENKLIKLKDEFSRKDLEISEIEFKYNTIANQNQDFQLENERLKTELVRLQELYTGKINTLETQLSIDNKSFEDTTAHYNAEFQKFKREGQEYIDTLTFEYERKIKNLEERLKTCEASRKDLGMDNKRLNDLLNANKMTFEEELREAVNRVRDQQNKKYVFLSKSSQHKLKLAQDSMDALNKKNMSLLKLIQEKQRQLQQVQHGSSTQNARLVQQIGDLNTKNNQLLFMHEKLKNDLNAKNAAIDRNVGESSQEAVYLKQQLMQKQREVEMLNQTIAEINRRMIDGGQDQERKRIELLEKIRMLEQESKMHKEKYDKLCALLSNKINETITHVSYTRP